MSTDLKTPFADDFTADDAGRLATTLKVLADPGRLQILGHLAHKKSLAVHELTELVGLSQPTISHHLGILRRAGLIRSEKSGSFVDNRIDRDALTELSRLLKPGGKR